MQDASVVTGRLVVHRPTAVAVAVAVAVCVLALTALSRIGPPAAAPPSAPAVRAQHSMKLGLAIAASSAIGAADARYAVHRRSGVLVAHGGGLATRFEQAGPRFATARGMFRLRLARIGAAHIAATRPRARGNRVVYARGPIAEWYRNGPLGVEQGFRIRARPRDARPGELRIALRATGRPVPRPSGAHGAVLVAPGGTVVARYRGLSVRDARGHAVAARIAVHGRTLAIAIADRGARYPLTVDPLVQQGAKLVDPDFTPSGSFGTSVALAGDGQTALIGADEEGDGPGAAWVFAKTGGQWVQQGPKLTPDDAAGPAAFGTSVALSADGSTALVGGYFDDVDRGAAWVFTRSQGTWTQQGAKLLPADPAAEPDRVLFGASVALSADGSTALVGGYGDAFGYGAAWVFTRSGTSWSQQGPKLTASDEVLAADGHYAWFGLAVALSADGGTALIGGFHDDEQTGAAWAFTRSGTSWTQQGPKLTANDESGAGMFGIDVALSADGSTALIGGENDDEGIGAAWTFTRSGGGWAQQGAKTTPPGAPESTQFGHRVALAAAGDSALIGAPFDADGVGGAWSFLRTGATWTPQGEKLVPSDPASLSFFGEDVALSADGATLLVGGPFDNVGDGAAWLFAQAPRALTVPQVVDYGAGDREPTDLYSTAELVGGSDPTGTLTFRLWGPDATDCSGPPVRVATHPVAGNEFYAVDYDPVSAFGVYQVVISYGGDAHNAAVATQCGDEHFNVRMRPELVAEVTGTREVGSPLQIATELRDGLRPSGQLELDVYGVNDPNCEEQPVLSRTLPVVDGKVASVDYVPRAVGKVYFQAQYSGDHDNMDAYRSCDGDRSTISIVRAGPTLVATAAPTVVGSPISASAHVSGGYGPTGTVTFALFPPADPTCSGPPAGTVTAKLDDGTAVSGEFATSAAGAYIFAADYGGDVNNRIAHAACGATRVEVAKRRPTLVDSASATGVGTLTDTAEVRDGFATTGTVAFALFGPDDPTCRRPAAFFVVAPLVGGKATTNVIGTTEPGRYEFVARYDGDANNEPAQTACGANGVVVPRPIEAPRTALRRAAPGHSAVGVVLACSGSSGQRCTGQITLGTSVPVRPRRRARQTTAHTSSARVITVGRARYRLDAGRQATRRVALDRTGRRLLRSRGRLRILVTVVTERVDDLSAVSRANVTLSSSGDR